MQAVRLDSLVSVFSASLATTSGIFRQMSCRAVGCAVSCAWIGNKHTRVKEKQEKEHPTALVSHPSFDIFSMFLSFMSLFFGLMAFLWPPPLPRLLACLYLLPPIFLERKESLGIIFFFPFSLWQPTPSSSRPLPSPIRHQFLETSYENVCINCLG